MRPLNRHLGLLAGICAVVCAAGAAWAQPWLEPPRLGYCYPAGGRQGETFEATLGGQYLRDVDRAVAGGGGVTVEVVDLVLQPKPNEVAAVREVFEEARKQLQAEAKTEGHRVPGGQLDVLRLGMELARKAGITQKQLDAVRRVRDQRKDPKRQLNPQLTDEVRVRITIAPDAAPGLREIRVMNKRGLSGPVRFVVGDLPEGREHEPNDIPTAARDLPRLPCVVNGQIMPGDVDRFRFRAEAGQRTVVRVQARALVPYLADAVPGWFQATVAVYDAAGREVAYADDFRFDPDPVLAFEAPADGTYHVEVRDAIYRGREDFVYRLAVGELPTVTGVFPLGVRQGRPTAVAVEGWNLPPEARSVRVTAERSDSCTLRVPGVARPVTLAVDDLPEGDEAEPNNDAKAAGLLAVPRIVNGRIGRPGDIDVYRFHAARGDAIVAEVQARRLGSPLDGLLRLTDAKGTVLAMNDDHADPAEGLMTHHADPFLAATIPATGEYLLQVLDTQGKGGSAYAYRLRLGPRRPDFAVRVVPSALSARGGSTVPLAVHAVRRDGFDGAIEVRLVDPPKGFVLAGGTLPAGQDTARLTLTVPAKPPAALTPLAMEAVARIGGRAVRRQVVPADDCTQAFILHHLVPAQAWTVAVEPARWTRATWAVDAQEPLQLRPGGTTVAHVRMPSRAPKGQLGLELDNPPEGVTLGKVTPDAGGLAFVLETDAEAAKAGLKGNLILNVFLERTPPAREDGPPPQVRKVPLGVLPAVPFEIAGKPAP